MVELVGKRIFILEDELLIRMALETIVEDLGCVVAATSVTVTEGLAIARNADIDAALLDVNVAGERSDAVAQVLADRGVALAFLTAYGPQGVSASFGDAYVIVKPYTSADVRGALLHILA